MKTTRVLIVGLLLAFLYVGSYASAHGLKTVKAHPTELVISEPFTFTVVDNNIVPFDGKSWPNMFGVIYSNHVSFERYSWYVPVTIGKVINKPLTNNRYKGLERWYMCGLPKMC